MKEFIKWGSFIIAVLGFLYVTDDRYISTTELQAFESQTVGSFNEFRNSVKVDQLYSKLSYLQNLRMQIRYYLNAHPNDANAKAQLRDVDSDIDNVKRKINELTYR